MEVDAENQAYKGCPLVFRPMRQVRQEVIQEVPSLWKYGCVLWETAQFSIKIPSGKDFHTDQATWSTWSRLIQLRTQILLCTSQFLLKWKLLAVPKTIFPHSPHLLTTAAQSWGMRRTFWGLHLAPGFQLGRQGWGHHKGCWAKVVSDCPHFLNGWPGDGGSTDIMPEATHGDLVKCSGKRNSLPKLYKLFWGNKLKWPLPFSNRLMKAAIKCLFLIQNENNSL